MKKLTLSTLMIASLFAACKKDDDKSTPVTSSAKGKIVSGTKWHITGWKFVMEGFPEEFDASAYLPSCYLDNVFTFGTDGSCVTEEGATKCNPGDPDKTTAGTWTLKKDDTQIYFTGFRTTAGISDITADIVELDEKHMVLHYNASPAGSVSSSNTTTYVAVD